jgi:ribosome-interacting GTPase 1
MPANLPPQYFEAEKRFRNAASAEEKVEALEAMLAIMPKHKGTDHLQADLRHKIAKITEEAERKYATSRKNFNIRKEGAGQIALTGMPNAGKSTILASLTNVQP